MTMKWVFKLGYTQENNVVAPVGTHPTIMAKDEKRVP